MDGTRKCHPEWGNPITMEHTWYALTDKWILTQKLRISKIQFTDHMKLKNKEGQSVDASVFLRKKTKYSQEQFWRPSMWQRLEERPSRDYPTGDSSHKQSPNLTLLLMLRSACWTEPDVAVSWGSLLEPYGYKGRRQQPTIVLSIGSPMEELKGGLEELKGFAASWEEQWCQPTRPSRAPRD